MGNIGLNKTDREKLIELLEKAKETYYTQTLIGELISGELTVEFVADYLIEHGVTIPVRCKDCIYNKNGFCYISEELDVFYNKDFYCAYGERKEE